MNEKLNNLAREVLVLSRNTLLVNLRFLDMALSRLKLHPIENSTLLTDGEFLLYNPRYILKCYEQAKEIPVRNYLHIVMHCVFQHMFVDPSLDSEYWDLACDIAVENIITELGLKTTASALEAEQNGYIEEIRTKLKYVTAEKIYVYLQETVQNRSQITEMRKLFYADDHAIWYMSSKMANNQYDLNSSNGNSSDTGDTKSDSGDKDNESSDDNTDSNDGNSNSGGGNCRDEGSDDSLSRTVKAQEWKRISERMETDIAMFGFGRDPHGNAGSMIQNLRSVNREKYDYTVFLKKFAVMGEVMKINDDEFDYIFYTYGLEQYKNMPLIEPLEYKEVKAIKDFVIAIDTSGSVAGDLVQSFLQKTYNILKTAESFFTKMNLHIIQCDAEIQEHVKITSQEEFDHYLGSMSIKGAGGTDFRPVFSFVDEMISRKEFGNLKGMIYFTDGYGVFPEKKPDYQVAVVFLDERYEIPEVPPWVIRLILQREEIQGGDLSFQT